MHGTLTIYLHPTSYPYLHSTTCNAYTSKRVSFPGQLATDWSNLPNAMHMHAHTYSCVARSLFCLVNALYNFVLKIPTFGGLFVWLLIGVKARKGLLISESDTITLYCHPENKRVFTRPSFFLSKYKRRKSRTHTCQQTNTDTSHHNILPLGSILS